MNERKRKKESKKIKTIACKKRLKEKEIERTKQTRGDMNATEQRKQKEKVERKKLE